MFIACAQGIICVGLQLSRFDDLALNLQALRKKRNKLRIWKVEASQELGQLKNALAAPASEGSVVSEDSYNAVDMVSAVSEERADAAHDMASVPDPKAGLPFFLLFLVHSHPAALQAGFPPCTFCTGGQV